MVVLFILISFCMLFMVYFVWIHTSPVKRGGADTIIIFGI
jgi:hypothetical protein